LKKRIRKPSKPKTKYQKIIIMSILFGALLVGGTVATFTNVGKNQNSDAAKKAQAERLISLLTNASLPGAEALGANGAPITIVEFGDYQCPVCASFNNVTKNNLTDNYINKGIAKFVFKDLIINDLPNDKLSSLAAEASYCAAEQNKYWPYHDELYNNYKGENPGWISRASLIEFAKDVKIDNIEQFTSCLDSHKYSQIVMKNDIFGKELGLGTAPTFFFIKQNSTKVAAIQGFHPYSAFKSVIDQLLTNSSI
jgi:protein-disulfide isomerase